jgi:putative membrane protein
MSVNVTNELAKERNRAAAERTLMAWIRTCLSLISFGFGLDKILAAINSRGDVQRPVPLSVVLVSVSFVVIGCLAMGGAIWQHRRVLRRLRREEYTYREEPSIAQATAVLLGLIGVVALMLLVVSAATR